MSSIVLGPFCHLLKRLPFLFDHEVVGYLLGVSCRKNEILTYSLIMARNISKEPTIEFFVEPKDILVASKVADNYSLEIIGVFHTHPGGDCKPSGKDLENMKLWPVVWIISSKNCISAFSLSGEGKLIEHDLICDRNDDS